MSTGLVTVNLDPAIRPKQNEFVREILRVASYSQQLQLARQAIVKTEEGSPERAALAEKIERLAPIVEDDYKFFFAGGAIRGGKSYSCFAALLLLAYLYPGSRWHIIRKSRTNLQTTSVKTMEDILRFSEGIYWKRGDKEYFVQISNGSRIYFTSEGYDSDKGLTKFLGLECNGVLLEQLEELQEDTYTIIKQRVGSFIRLNGPVPPAIILATFNPTYTWLKEAIYDPWLKGTLTKPFYFMGMLPSDNPDVTADQWKTWETLPESEYRRMIQGDWNIDVKGAFCYGFDEKRNVVPNIEIDWRYDIVLSFDFNVDPMTCVLYQTNYIDFARFIHEFRIENSDTYAMCEAIKPFVAGREHTIVVTGDASGKARISGTQGHINHYQIIKEKLGLVSSQFDRIPTVNPNLSDSRVFVNALLEKLPEFHVSAACEHLIIDLKFVQAGIDGKGEITIQKTGQNKHTGKDHKTMGHLLDCLRYALHSTFTNWLKIPKS